MSVNVTAIRTALAAQVGARTGVTTMAYMPDQVTVPVIAVLPWLPWKYGLVLDGGLPALMVTDLAFHVLVIISRAQDIQDVQAALDGYLGSGGVSATSVPDAILSDPTLGGAVSSCEVSMLDQYGPIPIAGQDYFGGRIGVQVIA